MQDENVANDQIGHCSWFPKQPELLSVRSAEITPNHQSWSQAKSLIIGEMADNFRADKVIYYVGQQQAVPYYGSMRNFVQFFSLLLIEYLDIFWKYFGRNFSILIKYVSK